MVFATKRVCSFYRGPVLQWLSGNWWGWLIVHKPGTAFLQALPLRFEHLTLRFEHQAQWAMLDTRFFFIQTIADYLP